jgi:hypothetical protein
MRLVAILFVLVPWLGIQMDMPLQKLDVGETRSVTGVMLFARPGAVHLLVSRGTQLGESSSLLPAGGPGPLVRAGELGGNGRVPWDARPAPGGTDFVTLYIQAESAVTWAMIRRPDGSAGSRLHLEPFAVYDHPRFVKGQPPGRLTVSAVKFDDEASIPMVFTSSDTFAGVFVPKAIGRYRGVRDARIVQQGSGYWLFLLLRVPGAIDNPTVRDLPIGAQAPAILHAVRLNADFSPLGEPTALFGMLPIYQFDADAAPDGRIVVFGTTPAGVVIARGALEPGQPWARDAWQETRIDQPLVSPSVLVQGDVVHLAAIADLEKDGASVLYGTTPLR